MSVHREVAERRQGSAGEDELSERLGIGSIRPREVVGNYAQKVHYEGNRNRYSDNQASHGPSLPPPAARLVAGGSSGGLGSQCEACQSSGSPRVQSNQSKLGLVAPISRKSNIKLRIGVMVARHTELEERRRQRVASVDMVVQVANFLPVLWREGD
jgi:hypothetical protein